MKDKEFEEYLRNRTPSPHEPNPGHEWRIEPQGFDWFNVTNGQGGYTVRGQAFADMLLQEINKTPEPEVRQPETPLP